MHSEGKESKRKVKILIVDDYIKNIEALSELISNPDVEIYSATSADEGLELIARNEFGLLLFDVQMPGINGFDLAKIVRSVRKYRGIPIIFITAHREDSNYVFEGYKSGAVDLLFKPVNPDMVRAKVKIFVELAQQKALLQEHVVELEKLRFDAEAANIAKSQFLANMSHEIRTPLAAVIGFTEMLCHNLEDNKDNNDLKSAVDRNGALLLKLIDDILDLTKVEANKLELEKSVFNLAELIDDIGTTLTFKAKEKGLSLEITGPALMDCDYLSDPTRIKQILLNIIGNAIKFTRQGTVHVKVKIAPGKPQTDNLSISVTDQGVGLSKTQIEKLFQPFVQADSSTRRHFGGSGLGLVISQQIARALGGDVRLISSQLGVGSIFEISLLLRRAQSEQPLQRKKEVFKEFNDNVALGFKDRRILVVDDSPDNLTMVDLFLKGTGVNLKMAENGLKAIELVKHNEFDLILMDVQMPTMDGHEATYQIRKIGFNNPIVALTAHAITEEKAKCIQSGCNSVITKPVSRARLISELEKYFKG